MVCFIICWTAKYFYVYMRSCDQLQNIKADVCTCTVYTQGQDAGSNENVVCVYV
jgi:hypothetical protein